MSVYMLLEGWVEIMLLKHKFLEGIFPHHLHGLLEDWVLKKGFFFLIGSLKSDNPQQTLPMPADHYRITQVNTHRHMQKCIL